MSDFYRVPRLLILIWIITAGVSVWAAQCPQGDLSGDCAVTIRDLLIFAEQWLDQPACQNPDVICPDFIPDGRIDIDDFTVLSHDWLKGAGPVIINEFLTSNGSRAPVDPAKGELLDEDGDSSDWIEIYNVSNETLDLGGWSLTDKAAQPDKWQFPDGTILEGYSYLVVFASEKNRTDPNALLHTNFNLSKDGEYLALVRPDGTISSVYDDYEYDLDQFGYPPQERDISYGLLNEKKRYFALPTPGKPNSEGWLGFVGDIEFSHKRGFYDQAFTLFITCETTDAKIRYTTDGSEPTEGNGIKYTPDTGILIMGTTPIRVAGFKTGYRPSRTGSQTYLFVDDIIGQSPNGQKPGPDWPAPEEFHGQDIDYGMDPEVADNPLYRDLMADAMTSIPTLSMTTDLANLFDPDQGIYVNAYRDGRLWERPGSIELIQPDGTQGFQVNCGIRIRGGFSRSGGNPKHAFRLFFRSEYGDANLNYPLFGNEGVSEFDKIDLRTAQNYSWSFRGGPWGMDNGSKNTMCREVWSRDTQGAMGQPYTRSRYYHLYINGQYWGLFQTQERPEARYAESYFGGNQEEYDVLKVEAGSYTVNVTDGTDTAYRCLQKAALDGFYEDQAYYRIQGLNPDGTRNSAYDVQLDLDNLIDYMAITYFTGNYDAPLSNFLGNRRPNNYYAIYNRNHPDGWKFFSHDAEHSLFLGWDRTGPWMHPDLERYLYFNPQWLHQQLTAHPEYRVRFGDRMHKYFFNNGLLTPDNGMKRFLDRAQQIDQAIIAESARWGDSKIEPPRTRNDDWLPEINRTLEEYFPYRTEVVLDQFIARGWYPQTKAPVYYIGTRYQHGGMVYPPDSILNIDNANVTGTVYYTLDGSDPRGPTAQQQPSTTGLSSPATGIAPASAGTSGDEDITPPAEEEPTYRILWVTDAYEADEEFTEVLEEAGYVVERHVLDMRNLSTEDSRFNLLNDSYYTDLVIVSSATFSIAYDQPDAWNSITAPLILMNGSLTRSGGQQARWKWLDSIDDAYVEAKDLWTEFPKHDLFYGVSMTGGNTVNIVTSETVFPRITDTGNGIRLAQRIPESADDDQAYVWIALWDPGVEFYPGSGQVPSGARMFFAAGEPLFMDEDAYNLNASGKRIFLNAIEIMLHYVPGEPIRINHRPIVEAGPDLTVMWPNDRISLKARIRDDYLPEDPGELSYTWSVLEGPAEVLFDRVSGVIPQPGGVVDPNAFFTQPGIYRIQLEAVDGEKTGFDTVQVRATEPAVSLELTKSSRVKSRVLSETGEWSALNEATYGIGPVKESLRISEILYHPAGDPNNEFIEVTNIGSETINIHWVSFTKGITFTFPDTELDPGDYVVAVGDIEKFQALYGTGIAIAGQYEGRLDDAGERIVLVDAVGAVIHDFDYKDSWYELTDGEGFSLTLINPNNENLETWQQSESWRPSAFVGGSPGAADSMSGSTRIPNPGDVIIHEVLAHSHGEAADWIELHNTTEQSINIGGWFLSDSNRDDPNRTKYEIPANTILPADGYRVFYQDQHFGSPNAAGCRIPFALSENGETVYLRSRKDNQGRFTGFFEKQSFGASATGIPFGRHETSTGTTDFVAMSQATIDNENAYPKVGPVVISEIMYEPPMGKYFDNDEFEYFELMNITGQPVPLQSYDNELNDFLPWRMTDGIDFTFPPDTVLKANERLLLVRNLDAFTDRYSVPANTQIFEWTDGRLNNAGEKVQLSMQGDQVDGVLYYIRLDSVEFSDASPWPQIDNRTPDLVDKPGQSLHLKNPKLTGQNYGNDPANWKAAAPTPGS
ncbi:MAG: lamin tail domain-containing protein [Sedimentisphaerales bacterium]|nr:lamin tail domain-containing protein [Sedimentisphaerales bacterium]